jgi:outer membrane lipoprotein carrier protein
VKLPRLLPVALLLLPLGALPAAAQDAPEAPTADAAPTVDAVVAAVEAKYASVDTIKADFTQVKKDAFGKVEQDGDVVLQRPTKMRWRFTTGEESQFVTDGDTLWIYTKADNQYMVITDTAQATGTANTFLTSLDSLDEVFQVTLVSHDDGPTLDLVPRKEGMYKKIRLALTADLVLERVVFTDVYDNVTDIAFRDVSLDAQVDPAVFTFTPPEGAARISN